MALTDRKKAVLGQKRLPINCLIVSKVLTNNQMYRREVYRSESTQPISKVFSASVPFCMISFRYSVVPTKYLMTLVLS